MGRSSLQLRSCTRVGRTSVGYRAKRLDTSMHNMLGPWHLRSYILYYVYRVMSSLQPDAFVVSFHSGSFFLGYRD